MFTQLKKDQSGLILVTVLIIILTMTIFAIGVLSINIGEVIKIEGLSDGIIAEELARKYYWWAYYNVLASNSYTETIQGRTYTINISWTPPPPPQNVVINVLY